MTARLAHLPGLIWDGEGPNPYFAFLKFADHILVTEDSANMAAEAASTGAPVHILPMIPLKPADKFSRLHADLRERGAARPFELSTYRPGTRAASAVTSSPESKMLLSWSLGMVVTDSGTSWIFSERRCAVTTITVSSLVVASPSCARAGVATAASATASAVPAAQRRRAFDPK